MRRTIPQNFHFFKALLHLGKPGMQLAHGLFAWIIRRDLLQC
nr:MAG TPA: hypothetical protein [Caudoviricetes sp.]